MNNLQKLQEEARKKFDDTYGEVFKATQKPMVYLKSMLHGGDKSIYGYSISYTEITDIKDFIEDIITKAYHAGKDHRS